MDVVQRRIPSILDGFYRCHDEGLKVITSSSSCWRLVQFVVSYCCDIPEVKNKSDAGHEATVDCPCIWYLFSREAFCSMNCEVIWNMAGTLSARKEFSMIMDRVCGMKKAVYGQVIRQEMLKAGRLCSGFCSQQLHHSWSW